MFFWRTHCASQPAVNIVAEIRYLSDAEAAAQVVAQRPPEAAVTLLDVSKTTFDVHVAICKTLCVASKHSNKNGIGLETLVLSNSRVHRKSIRSIGRLVASSQSLKSLYMRRMWLDDAAIESLCESLAENKSLKYIDWSGNTFGDDGLAALIELLRHNKTIVGVDLRDNVLCGNIGLVMFLALESCNYTLTKVLVDADYESLELQHMCARNSVYQWRTVHAIILDVVLALEPAQLTAYPLLWIMDFFPYWEVAHTEYHKVTLIVAIIDSMRRIKAARTRVRE